MDTILTIIALITAAAGGYALGKLHHWARNLTRRVATLEEAQAKHLPYKSADEIENSIAALNYIMFDDDLKRERIQNALEHLQNACNPKGR